MYYVGSFLRSKMWLNHTRHYNLLHSCRSTLSTMPVLQLTRHSACTKLLKANASLAGFFNPIIKPAACYALLTQPRFWVVVVFSPPSWVFLFLSLQLEKSPPVRLDASLKFITLHCVFDPTEYLPLDIKAWGQTSLAAPVPWTLRPWGREEELQRASSSPRSRLGRTVRPGLRAWRPSHKQNQQLCGSEASSFGDCRQGEGPDSST